MAEQNKTRTIILAVILVAAIAGGVVYMQLSKTTPPPSPPQPAQKQVEKDSLPAAEAPKAQAVPVTEEIVPSDNPPLTLTALKYMPGTTQFAYGIPPVTSLIDHVAPFVQELVADEMDVSAELEAIARDLAKDMGVEESADLAQVISSMGFDSKQGLAVFLDISQVMQDMFDTFAEKKEITELPDMSAIKAVIVIPVIDANKAKESLQKFTQEMLSGITPAEEKEGDIIITSYPELGGYFVNDTVLAVGNDLPLLKEAAARAANPAQFQYGSASCPAEDIHEAALLVQGAKFIPFLENAAKLIAEFEPSVQAIISAQMEQMKTIYSGGTSNDPMIVTLSVREDAVELKSKLDTANYPALLTSMGEAKPLHWAPRLPENTLAFLSICFSPEVKKQITDIYLPTIPEEMRNQPGVAQGMMYGKSAMEMIGREITIAMTDLASLDFPSAYLIIELAKPDAAKMLLTMAPQLPHGDPYREIQIKMINFPSPIQLYFAQVDDAVIVSNNDVGIQKLIDMAKDGKNSGFFESLTPPIDATIPIYQAMMIKPNVYTDIVNPLATLAGRSLPKEIGDISATLSDLFNDIRFLNEMESNWLVSRILISRKSKS